MNVIRTGPVLPSGARGIGAIAITLKVRVVS
jgi:hypothetical protein